MSDFIEWGALGQVLVAGVLVGAGIPALFALGLRLLAGTTADATPVADPDATPVADPDAASEPWAATAAPRPTPLRLAGAIACLVVVVGAVATGLFVVVSGGH